MLKLVLKPVLKRGSLCFFSLMLSLSAQAAPGVGDPAPDFLLPGSDGAQYRLSELRGRQVVIAFFPKAFTGG